MNKPAQEQQQVQTQGKENFQTKVLNELRELRLENRALQTAVKNHTLSIKEMQRVVGQLEVANKKLTKKTEQSFPVPLFPNGAIEIKSHEIFNVLFGESLINARDKLNNTILFFISVSWVPKLITADQFTQFQDKQVAVLAIKQAQRKYDLKRNVSKAT